MARSADVDDTDVVFGRVHQAFPSVAGVEQQEQRRTAVPTAGTATRRPTRGAHSRHSNAVVHGGT
jgi:hypothetical protein